MLCSYRLVNPHYNKIVTDCAIDSYALLEHGVMLRDGNVTDIIPWNNLAYIRFQATPDDDMKIWEKGEADESKVPKKV